jgi:hypothetical protein
MDGWMDGWIGYVSYTWRHAVLAAIGFWRQRKLSYIPGLSSRRVDRSLMGMAAVFALYAFFAGLVVPSAPFFPASILNYAAFKDAVGIPAQFFRAVCALLMAYLITGILHIFNVESQNRLEKANALVSAHFYSLSVQMAGFLAADTLATSGGWH